MSFEGEIGEIDLVQRLVDLGRDRFTGAIRFENDGIIKIVYFKGGDVLSASTNDRADSIDEILFRAGKITREHIKQALAKRKENETLGDALLGLGFITRKELTWARRVQVIGIIRSTLGWTAGSWTIVENYLPKREEGTIFPLAQVLLELIVTDPDRPKFEQAMSSGSAVFRRVDGFAEAFARLGLNEDAEAITSHLDGVRSAAEVASISGKDIFNVYKLLEALRVLRLLERSDVSADGSSGSAGAGLTMENQFDSLEVDNPGFTMHDEESAVAATPAFEEPMAPSLPAWDAPPSPVVASPLAAAAPAPRSAWDEPEDDGVGEALQASPTAEADWGFDEAQIEAARRATSPGTTPRPDRKSSRPAAQKPARSIGGIAAIVALLLLGAGGWGAWTWWQGQQASRSEVATRRADQPRHVPAAAGTPAFPAGRNQLSHTGPAVTQPARATSRSTPAVGSPVAVPAASKTAASAGPGNAVRTSPSEVPRDLASKSVRLGGQGRTGTPAATASPTSSGSMAKTAPPMERNPRVERISRGATAVTNGAAVKAASPASASGLQTKYEEMGRAFAANPDGKYTAQVELVCETASVTRALQSGGSNVWFVPTTFRGRSCYRIFWGRFDSHEAALAAVGSIPAGLRGSVPVVVKVPRS